MLFVRQRGAEHWIRLGRDWVWMVPVAEAGVFTLTGLLVAAILARRASPRLQRWAFRLLILLSLLSVLTTAAVLHMAAVVLLAAGLTDQLSRFVQRHGETARDWVARSLPWLAAAVVVLGAFRAYAHHRSYTAPPLSAGARSDAPNVLLITLDTVRAASLSLHGYDRPTTPTLERLARQGTVFDRAISTAPWTLPSHASLFTGHEARDFDVGAWGPLARQYPTIAERLNARGYRSGGFAANTIFCSYVHGLNRGFAYYSDYTVSVPELLLSSAAGRVVLNAQWLRELMGYHDVPGRRTAADVNHAFLAWVDRDGTRPFVAFLNYFDAHEPYLPPEPFRSRFDRGHSRRFSQQSYRTNSARIDEKWTLSADEVEGEIDAYDGAIAYLDDQVGRVLAALDARGRLSRTLVIVTSDHGEEFGEHRVFSHGHSMYLRSIHVPLVMVFPQVVPAGRRVGETVSLRDIPATIQDLIGYTGAERLPGSTLRDMWNGAGRPRPAVSERAGIGLIPDWYPIARGDMVSVVHRGFHYIRRGDGHEELFDLAADADERRSLADDQAAAPALAELRAIARRK